MSQYHVDLHDLLPFTGNDDDVFLRFEVFTAVNNNITVFWDVTSYSLVGWNEGAPSADGDADSYVIIRKLADSISTHFRYSYTRGKRNK
jgi:hypothetical protein